MNDHQSKFPLHVEQELLTLPEHLSSPLVFSVAWSFIFCVMFCRLLFVLFLLAIVFFVTVRFTAFDYPFQTFHNTDNIKKKFLKSILLEILNNSKGNLAWIVLGWPSTLFTFIVQIGEARWPPWQCLVWYIQCKLARRNW